MELTEDLILTPPLWASTSDPSILAYGPFVVEYFKKPIIGMYLTDDTDETIGFWDGSRQRYFGRDEISLRGLEAKDAKLVGLDPKRAGLKKEDVITKALLIFQTGTM